MTTERVFGWAIVGTGLMGKLFPPDLMTRKEAKIVSIISRNKESAIKLAKLHGLDESVCFDSFEAGVNRKEVDVVYLATPPSEHSKEIQLASKFGKAVLCEKPFTSDGESSRLAIKTVRENGTFLMEALFSHWTPLWLQLRRICEGSHPDFSDIGKPLQLTCAIGIPQKPETAPSLFDRSLDGGALGAVSVYPINLCYVVFGKKPTSFEGRLEEGETKVDEVNEVTFHYEGGRADWKGFIRKKDAESAIVKMEKGEIEVEAPWWYPSKIRVRVQGKEEVILEETPQGKGYGFEVDEVHRCLKEGKKESPLFSLDTSQEIMDLMDDMRKQLTIPYNK